MHRPLRIALTPLLVGTFALAACGSDSEPKGSSKGGDFSVVDLLGQLPTSANEGATVTQLVFGDIDRATELAGTERPASDGASEEDVVAWIGPLTGLARDGEQPTVYLPLPESVSPQRVASSAEIADELGWSVIDVRSYAEIQNPPNTFAVLDQSKSADDISGVVGEPDGDVWRIGGEDFSADLDEVSAARPIGQSVRMAFHDGLLAVARSTPPVEEWLGGDASTLADDAALHAVAEGLDDAGVYSAMIVATDFSIDTTLGLRSTPEQVEAILAEAKIIAPFDTLGIGLAVDDGEPVATFVYHHADADAADANLDLIEAAFTDGTSLVNQRPFSELFSVRDVTVDGELVVVTVEFEEARPSVVYQMIYTRDLLTTHG